MKAINGKATETFSDPLSIDAVIKTVSGVRAFDSTNIDTVITHQLIITYNEAVTAEKWVKLNTKRIRIVTVENCAEKNKAMKLLCTERGTEAAIVNQG
jgi:SPP1 family predicted phage head-tail adaptor